MMKKLISVLLALAMLAVPVLSASAEEPPGAEGEYTLIRTADDLKNAAEGNYRLANDIDLGGQELTVAFATLGGVLDGNGHSITGFSLKLESNNVGLLLLRGELTVRNLTVGSPDAPVAVSGGTSGAGGDAFAGVLLRNTSNSGRAYNVTFENVHIWGDVAANGAHVGGFIGQVSGAAVRFTNCTMNGELRAAVGKTSTGAAGFIGSLTGSGSVLFEQCINNAAVTRTDTNSDACSAGFIGFVNTTGSVSVTVCINNGAVSGLKLVGGLFGYLYAAGGGADVNGVWNSADIIGATIDGNKGLFVGAVFGRKQCALTVENLFNSGDILCEDNFYGAIGGHNSNGALSVTDFVTEGTARYGACAGTMPAPLTNAYFCGTYSEATAGMTALNDRNAVVKTLNAEGFMDGFRKIYGDFTAELTPITFFPTVEVAGYQLSADGTDLRLIGYVDALGYAGVGFGLEIGYEGRTEVYEVSDITSVYTAVQGGGDSYTAKDTVGRSGFLYAFVIEDVPAGAVFTVTPCCMLQDGSSVNGPAAVVTMPAGQ